MTIILRICCLSLFLFIHWKTCLAADSSVFIRARASDIDARCKSYPKIGFYLGTSKKPQDIQVARFDPKSKTRGQLVIWMMAHQASLAERINSYGYHYIQPHYARHWFSRVCRQTPVGEHCRGNMRLEAATGRDFSKEADLQEADGMMERVRQFLIWLEKNEPKGQWGQYLSHQDKQVLWEKVVIAGASHGASTSARFAKHKKVARVVMLCGPRDQFQSWQALPSATPSNRYFGFTHTLDAGWTKHHYCRSWDLMGLHQLSPIINVDTTEPPYAHSRRLISSANVANHKHAHSGVQPFRHSPKDKDGNFLYEDVWRYLFTHPVDQINLKDAGEPSCKKKHTLND